MTEYKKDGAVIFSSSTSDSQLHFEPVIPETFGEAALAFACVQSVIRDPDKYTLGGKDFMRVADPETDAKEAMASFRPARAPARKPPSQKRK